MPSFRPFHYPQEQVGIRLLIGAQRAVTLDVCERLGAHEVILLEVPCELHEPLVVVRAVLLVDHISPDGHPVQRFTPHAPEDTESLLRACADHVELLDEVVRAHVEVVEPIDHFPGKV